MIRVITTMIALTLLGVLPAAAATKKKTKTPSKPQIAVLDFEGRAPAADKAAIQAELRALLPTDDFVLQPPEKTAATLDAVKKLGLACDSGDVDCLIRVGALTGATIVIKGLLSTDGEGFVLDLVAADINGLRERGRVRVKVPAAAGARRPALESAVVGVLRPEAWRGQLRVAVSQRGASIVVDGVPRGFSPLSAPIELTPGPHAVFVGLEGFAAWKQTVEVVYADEVAVDVVLAPGVAEEAPTFSTKPTPPPPPPVAAMPPSRRGPLRVIVYDVERVGVEPRVAAAIGTFLVAELRKREQVSVLDSGELRALVGDGTTTAGDARGCTEDQCFSEVAEALGADAVVVASLTRIEAETVFGLRRIDPTKQEVVGSFIARVPGDDAAALLPLIGRSIESTFPDVALRPGQRAGVDDKARLVLSPPPLPPLLAGSLTAGAIVAGSVGGVLGGAAFLTWNEHRDGVERRRSNDVLAPLAARFDVLQLGAFVGVGAGAVLGIAGGITSLFTDWEGYAEAVPTTGAAR
jgi:hypothetical protein